MKTFILLENKNKEAIEGLPKSYIGLLYRSDTTIFMDTVSTLTNRELVIELINTIDWDGNVPNVSSITEPDNNYIQVSAWATSILIGTDGVIAKKMREHYGDLTIDCIPKEDDDYYRYIEYIELNVLGKSMRMEHRHIKINDWVIHLNTRRNGVFGSHVELYDSPQRAIKLDNKIAHSNELTEYQLLSSIKKIKYK